MGGKAMEKFSEVKKRRYTAEEYKELAKSVVSDLQLELGDARRIDMIPAYRNKRTYGDLDILVEIPSDERRHAQAVHAAIRSAFDPVVVVHQVNSDVISFSYKSFQVDVILTPTEEYEFSMAYFGYNDLGNLIGRIADAMGFKFGHDGLWYNCYWDENKTQMFQKILVTRNVAKALEFLGFSYARYQQGFDTLRDVFDYVMQSQFFNSQLYLLENRNYKARTRDSKRASYMAFLNHIRYCEDQREKMRDAFVFIDYYEFSHSVESGYWDNRAAEFFPEFMVSKQEAFRQYKEELLFKNKINGETVSRVTGLNGQELGAFMKHLKKTGDSISFWRDWVISDKTTQEQIDTWIKSVFVHYP